MLSIGKVCSFPGCSLTDFLPSKCGACGKTFCYQHALGQKHQCQRRDALVPTCPLCNALVPLTSPEEPVDQAVDAHIRRGCMPARRDPAPTFACDMIGCTSKERSESLLTRCDGCGRRHCLSHRHPADHRCGIVPTAAATAPRQEVPPSPVTQLVPHPPPLQRLHVTFSNTAHSPIVPPNQALGDCIVVQVYFPLRLKVLGAFFALPRTAPFQAVSFLLSNHLKTLTNLYHGDRLTVYSLDTLEPYDFRQVVGSALKSIIPIPRLLLEHGPPLEDELIAQVLSFLQ